MPLNEVGLVRSNTAGGSNWPNGYVNGSSQVLDIDPSGAQVVMDFYLKAMLAGAGYQVRAGTITTPLIGDVVLTDTAAEFCVDPGAGRVLLPVQQFISIRLSTGTLHEYATKSVATASSAGTAFVLLPLLLGGPGPASSARVSAAGGVTVTAELATTTRRHWSWSNPAAGFTGALPGDQHQEWCPRTPPPILPATCLYTQIAATGTGPSYYANLDVLDFARTALGI
jgi:hypothetical protein